MALFAVADAHQDTAHFGQSAAEGLTPRPRPLLSVMYILQALPEYGRARLIANELRPLGSREAGP